MDKCDIRLEEAYEDFGKHVEQYEKDNPNRKFSLFKRYVQDLENIETAEALKEAYIKIGKNLYMYWRSRPYKPDEQLIPFQEDIQRIQDAEEERKKFRRWNCSCDWDFIVQNVIPTLLFNIFQLGMWFVAGFNVYNESVSFYDMFNDLSLSYYKPYLTVYDRPFEINAFKILCAVFVLSKVFMILQNIFSIIKKETLRKQFIGPFFSAIGVPIMILTYYLTCKHSYAWLREFKYIQLNSLAWILIIVSLLPTIFFSLRFGDDK